MFQRLIQHELDVDFLTELAHCLSEAEFTEISANISVQLLRMGFETETKWVAKGAYHCHIRFPRLLFAQGLSG